MNLDSDHVRIMRTFKNWDMSFSASKPTVEEGSATQRPSASAASSRSSPGRRT